MSQVAYPQKPAPYAAPAGEPPKKSGCGCGCMGCLAACFIMLLVCAIFCGVGAYLINKNLPSIIRDAVDEVLTETQVDLEDKREIMTQVDRVADGYRDGEISIRELSEMAEKLQESPLVPILIVKAIEQQYIARSGLEDDEKQEARIVIGRLARGMFEEKISETDRDRLLERITEDPPQRRKIKQVLNDKELREFIVECKDVVDKAGIPDEPFTVNPAKELRRIIDEVLGMTPEMAPPQIELPPEPTSDPPPEPTSDPPSDPEEP